MSISGSGISPGGNQIPEEIQAIYQGGENFLARMKAMLDMRTSLEKARSDLNLGQEIVALRQQVSDDAKKSADDRAAAQDILNGAKEQAKSIVDQANAEAARIRQEMDAKILASGSAANNMKQEADRYVAKVKAEIDDAAKLAAKLKNEVSAKHAELSAAIEAAKAREADAENAKASHDEAKSLYEQKVAQIKAVMG